MDVSEQVSALSASSEEAAASVEEITAGAFYSPEFLHGKCKCRCQCESGRTGSYCNGGGELIGYLCGYQGRFISFHPP